MSLMYSKKSIGPRTEPWGVVIIENLTNKVCNSVFYFNKIAIQGTPQMAVDMEAIAYRESTHEYYSKCNLPLY